MCSSSRRRLLSRWRLRRRSCDCRGSLRPRRLAVGPGVWPAADGRRRDRHAGLSGRASLAGGHRWSYRGLDVPGVDRGYACGGSSSSCHDGGCQQPARRVSAPDWATGGVIAAPPVGAFGYEVLHRDPAEWTTPSGGTASSNVITMTVSIVVYVAGGSRWRWPSRPAGTLKARASALRASQTVRSPVTSGHHRRGACAVSRTLLPRSVWSLPGGGAPQATSTTRPSPLTVGRLRL
jgi:hypothetical protein